MSQSNGAMSTKAWRNQFNHGIEVVLPSGLLVLLRPLTFAFLLDGGRLPEELHFFVLGDSEGDTEKFTLREFLLKQQEYHKTVCKHALAAPVITDEDTGKDGELPFYLLDPGDIEFIIRTLNRGVVELKRFRESGRSMEFISANDNGSPATELHPETELVSE